MKPAGQKRAGVETPIDTMKNQHLYRSGIPGKGLFLLVILFLTAGCALKTIPEPVFSPDQARVRLSHPPAAGLFTATARIAVDSPRGSYSKTMVLALKNPSFLRIETLPLFGPSDLMLSTNGETFKVFLPGEGTYYVGAATQENMYRFFGIALSPRHIIPLLTGEPPLYPSDAGDGELRIYRESGRYRADLLPGDGKSESLWLNPESLMLEALALRDAETGTSFSVTFDNFVHLKDRSCPGLIKVDMEEPERMAVTIRYSDMEVSDDATGHLFDLAIPPGITPIVLGE